MAVAGQPHNAWGRGAARIASAGSLSPSHHAKAPLRLHFSGEIVRTLSFAAIRIPTPGQCSACLDLPRAWGISLLIQKGD